MYPIDTIVAMNEARAAEMRAAREARAEARVQESADEDRGFNHGLAGGEPEPAASAAYIRGFQTGAGYRAMGFEAEDLD